MVCSGTLLSTHTHTLNRVCHGWGYSHQYTWNPSATDTRSRYTQQPGCWLTGPSTPLGTCVWRKGRLDYTATRWHTITRCFPPPFNSGSGSTCVCVDSSTIHVYLIRHHLTNLDMFTVFNFNATYRSSRAWPQTWPLAGREIYVAVLFCFYLFSHLSMSSFIFLYIFLRDIICLSVLACLDLFLYLTTCFSVHNTQRTYTTKPHHTRHGLCVHIHTWVSDALVLCCVVHDWVHVLSDTSTLQELLDMSVRS